MTPYERTAYYSPAVSSVTRGGHGAQKEDATTPVAPLWF